MFDPVYYATGVTQGRYADLKVANYIGFFIESRQGNNVTGRITPVAGILKGSLGPAPSGVVPKSHSSRGVTMAQLAALLVSTDEDFRRDCGRLVRSGNVPIGIVDDRRGSEHVDPDLAFVDLRVDAAGGLGTLERLRAAHPAVSIFAIAQTTEPDLILQAMRAGANEFFVWPLPEDAFHAAVRRAAARRETSNSASRQPSQTLLFFGAKGGAGTTTVAVNCAVEIARLAKPTLILDLKPCFGEAALFLGMRPRFTVLDAIDNLHRLDRDFLRELVAKHKSDLEILAGSEQADRPSAADAGAIEELFRVLGRAYDYVVVDAGNAINSCTISALYAADTIFVVVNPDVPSVRNAQRMIDRVRQLGVGGERVQVLLNRLRRTRCDVQPDRDGTRVSGAPPFPK